MKRKCSCGEMVNFDKNIKINKFEVDVIFIWATCESCKSTLIKELVRANEVQKNSRAN